MAFPQMSLIVFEAKTGGLLTWPMIFVTMRSPLGLILILSPGSNSGFSFICQEPVEDGEQEEKESKDKFN